MRISPSKCRSQMQHRFSLGKTKLYLVLHVYLLKMSKRYTASIVYPSSTAILDIHRPNLSSFFYFAVFKPLVCILWKIYTCLINSIHLNILIESICCVDFFAFHSSVVVNMQITIQHGLETSVQFSEEGFLKILVTCRNCK